jgi:hypothetical protein
MLRWTQANALGAKATGIASIWTIVGVGAHREVIATNVVGPREDCRELLRRSALSQVHSPADSDAPRAIQRDPITFIDRQGGRTPHREVPLADFNALGAYDGRLAPTSCNDCSMADEAAARGEDPLGGQDALNILR